MSLRKPVLARALVAAAAASACVTSLAVSAPAAQPRPESRPAPVTDQWIMNHHDAPRTGYDPDAAQASGHLAVAWQTQLDHAAYAEPLVVGEEVIAATEGDTVYGLSLAGDIEWSLNLGDPVPASELPCANIDPLGITGTPIYSPKTGELYVAAELDNPIRHELFAVNLTTHSVDWSRNLDPAGMPVEYQQQRPALAIAHGKVWTSFGGQAGICGPYHGYEVGYALDGQGDPAVYQTPAPIQAGIWEPSGPAVGTNGNLYVATGAAKRSLHPPYDYSNGLLELDGNAQMVDYFAPRRWAHENAHDQDLGSTGPVTFRKFGEDWVWQNGKQGTGYLLHQDALGGIGGQAASIHGCKAWGGSAYVDSSIYVSCKNALQAYRLRKGPSLEAVWRNRSLGYGAAPVIGGGAVWAAFQSRIWQIDPQTGKTVTTASTGAQLPHFATPTLHDSLVIVGTMSGVSAVSSG